MSDPGKAESADFELRFLERIVSERPNYIEALIPLAEAYTRQGLYEKGLELDRRLAVLLRNDPVVHYNLACSFALTGKKNEALAALKHAIEIGYDDGLHMAKDPDLKSLRGLPAFQKLLKALDA